MRLATYNVHAGIGSDGRADPARIEDVVRALDADVVALQEVHETTSSGARLFTELCAMTGMSVVAGPTFLRDEGEFGNMLLTRAPLHGVVRHDISVAGREPRGVLQVELEGASGPVCIWATHLGLRAAERAAQIQRLLEMIRNHGTPRGALLGDINEWRPWARMLRRANRYFGQAIAPRTYPSQRPLVALDRIWVYGHAELRGPLAVSSDLARAASDHLPLIADVTW